MEKSFYNIVKNKKEGTYIYNTFSKAAIKLNNEYAMRLEENRFDEFTTEEINTLKKMGFIVESVVEEREIIHNKYLSFRNNKEILFITLIPTYNCNCRCPYCFEGNDIKIENSNIDFDLLKKAMPNLIDGNKKHIHITLFGGEPLLQIKEIEKYFDYLKMICDVNNIKYTSSIATNAYLLDDRTIDLLIDKCHTESFQITIDGYRKSHNIMRALAGGAETYDRMISNFRKLVARNNSETLNLLLRINLLNNTIEEVRSVFDEFEELEKKKFEVYFRPIYNTKNFSENNQNALNLNEFYMEAKKNNIRIHYGDYVRYWHCEGDGGAEQFNITPDLKIWKCINDSSYDDANIGYIDKEGEIHMDYQKVNAWMRNDPFVDKKCRECKMLPICWGGCPMQYNKTKDRVCIYEKEFDFVETFIAMN